MFRRLIVTARDIQCRLEMRERLHLRSHERRVRQWLLLGLTRCRRRHSLDQRMTDQPSGLDLSLECFHRWSGFAGDPQTSPLGGAPRFGNGIDEIFQRSVETVLSNRKSLQQAVTPGSKLLDLCPSSLSFPSEIAASARTTCASLTMPRLRRRPSSAIPRAAGGFGEDLVRVSPPRAHPGGTCLRLRTDVLSIGRC